MKLSKNLAKAITKTNVLKTLGEAKKSMTMLELKKVVTGVNRKIMRELGREGLVKWIPHYAHNSSKTFVHSETKKLEEIKGTYYHTFEIVK